MLPGTVIIYFTETERAEEEYFAMQLEDHQARFVERLEDVPEDAEALALFIESRVDTTFLAAHPQLRLVTTRSTALDHLDLRACRTHGVTVCFVPNYGETTVAEHTFALLLALSRRLREFMLLPKDGRFSYENVRGFDLAGKTLGIVGMGRIGQRVVRIAQAFDLRVLAHDVDAPPELARTLGFDFVPLDQLFAEAHIISLHAPLSPATYHLLNRETLARCRPGVLILNTARGALIHTEALREALDSGQVGGAGLDVLQDERVLRDSTSHIIAADIVKHLRSDALAHEARDAERVRELHELMLGAAVLSRTNVVFTPHVAFNSEEAVQRLREVTVENLRAFAAGQPINLARAADEI